MIQYKIYHKAIYIFTVRYEISLMNLIKIYILYEIIDRIDLSEAKVHYNSGF